MLLHIQYEKKRDGDGKKEVKIVDKKNCQEKMQVIFFRMRRKQQATSMQM